MKRTALRSTSLVIAVLVGVILVLVTLHRRSSGPSSLALNHVSPPQSSGGEALAVPGATPRSRHSSVEAKESVVLGGPSDDAGIEGSVVDLRGRPVQGAHVFAAPNSGFPWTTTGLPLATTDAAGSFVAHLQEDVLVVAKHELWATAFAGRPRSPCSAGLTIVVAPRVTLRGVVLDRSHEPIPAVRVEIMITPNDLSQLTSVSSTCLEWPQMETVTDETGRFAFVDVPCIANARLVASYDGYESVDRRIACGESADLSMVMGPEIDETRDVTGMVVDENRAPVEGASVRLGILRSKTGVDGRFVLKCPNVVKPWPLFVTKAGFQPFVNEQFGELLWFGKKPQLETIVLRQPALDIRGVVVDANSAPCAGWRVNLVDPTSFMADAEPLEVVESDGNTTAQTGPDGTFVLSNVLPRAYTVMAWNSKTLANVRAESVVAGTTDLVLRATKESHLEMITGVVMSKAGARMPGVTVTPILVVQGRREGRPFSGTTRSGAGAVTDALGMFTLRDVPRGQLALMCHGESIIPIRIAATIDSDAPLQLEVSARRSLQVRCDNPIVENMYFRILNREGDGMDIYMFASNTLTIANLYTFESASSPVVSVGEDAATIEFLVGQRLLLRSELNLSPDAVTTIRY